MDKLAKLFILAIIVALLICGCGKDENHIIEISYDNLKEKLDNKESFALYVGNEGCTHCQSYKPVLTSVLNEYDIDIFQLDNSKLTVKEYNEFKSILNVSGTPTIIFITNGEEETTLNRIVGEKTKQETIDRFKTNGYIK